MKKVLLLFAMVAGTALGASAQYHYQDAANVDMLRPVVKKKSPRKEIVIPNVGGY